MPTSTASRSVKPSPSRERLQADPGIDVARLRRPSEENLFKRPLPRASSPNKALECSHGPRDVSQTRASHGGTHDSETSGGEPWEPEARNGTHNPEALEPGRTSRPTLSDRTIETLSQIPQSPSSVKRMSNFFVTESPMRPPSRPTSAMNNYSRSPTRPPSRQQNGDEAVSRVSSMRLPSRSRIPAGPSSTNQTPLSQRSASSTRDAPPKPVRSTARQSLGPEKLQSFGAATTSKRAEALPARTGTYSGSKSLSARSSKPRHSVNNALIEPSEPELSHPSEPLSIKKTRKSSSNFSSNTTSPSSTVSKVSSATSAASDTHIQEQQSGETDVRKVTKSSNALRESIAKAKAARKAAKQNNSQAGCTDPWDNIDVQDPFNQLPKDKNKGLLLKRVEAARTSGNLNIAAMGLKEIPKEVMTMYEFDPNSTSDWYESVDLVKFIAADNELAELPDAAFPDIDPNNFDLDEDEKGNQFGGLEVLDLHGNVLRSLPIGLRRLQRLRSLNLSNNRLSMDDIEVVTEIETLTDLKLANNNLEGMLLPAVGRLNKLEVLDLRGNCLTALPDTLAELICLKVLNLGENQFTSLPFEILSQLPLIELNAPRNRLQGSLIPASVHRFDTLQILNVVSNALERLSDNESFDFPNLKTLSIDMNRIKSLPNMSSWKELLTLSAEDNSIATLPEGFVELKNIKHVDLTRNDLSKLDERIGLMENLFTFRIANNPLREKKFLTMDTEDLKQELRNRCAPEPEETEEEEGSVATEFTLAPESPVHANTWKVKPGGVLDRSSTEMTDLNVDDLEPLVSSHDIRCLYINHNKLQSFPVPALSLLAHTLTDLDLSSNPLNSAGLISAPLSLPNLQNLNLSATGLTSLEPLQAKFSAPSLTFLDVSNNRLTGPLPSIRHTYPNLITFLAADNQITSLHFESVQGLQVLDVSNNSIDFLPPKLGLLAAESSGGPGLRRLEVAGNSFRVPRWQIVAKGTEALLEWLRGRIPAEELKDWETGEEGTLSTEAD